METANSRPRNLTANFTSDGEAHVHDGELLFSEIFNGFPLT